MSEAKHASDDPEEKVTGMGPTLLAAEARTGIDPRTFIEWFRSSAPYIHAHRGRTFVIAFGGEAVESRGLRNLVHDVALLHSLGVRLVLVAGTRPQIERRLGQRGSKSRYVNGVRVTDALALACAKDAAGSVRLEVEALLSMGLPNSPMAGARLRVAAGNFVLARPVGVIDGVDYQHTGEVRRIDAEGIRQRLDAGAVVLLTSIGYSTTGELFNVSSHDVAAATAIALGADKLISMVEGRGVTDHRGRPLHELTVAEATKLLDRKTRYNEDLRRHLRAAIRVSSRGVRRAHLVPRRIDGSLLLELFSRDGIGCLVSNERFEGIRAAGPDDVAGILELIEPLETEGLLVRRSREMLEMDIDRFSVVERDGMVVACAALYPYVEENVAELACLAVHPRYREEGRGEELLAFIERRCIEQGIGRVFALTTRATHWFRERGFEPAKPRDLPTRKRALYDKRRNSKVLIKHL